MSKTSLFPIIRANETRNNVKNELFVDLFFSMKGKGTKLDICDPLKMLDLRSDLKSTVSSIKFDVFWSTSYGLIIKFEQFGLENIKRGKYMWQIINYNTSILPTCFET